MNVCILNIRHQNEFINLLSFFSMPSILLVSFPDSKQVGMPESKQHTMFTNLVSHFSPSVGKFISFNLSPRLIVFQLPFDIMFQSQYV